MKIVHNNYSNVSHDYYNNSMLLFIRRVWMHYNYLPLSVCQVDEIFLNSCNIITLRLVNSILNSIPTVYTQNTLLHIQ